VTLRAADRAISVRWRNDPEIRDGILGYRFPVTAEMEANSVNSVLKDQSRTRVILVIEDDLDAPDLGDGPPSLLCCVRTRSG